jgi:WD40 repeat protein
VTCLSINFPKNGKYILSGWSDDSIRIFSPKNGKLIHHVRESNLGKVKEMISDEDSTM